jgi:hypothetical protein
VTDASLIMFLKAYTELPVDFDQVQAAMEQGPHEWLRGMAAEAGLHGERMLVDVGLQVGGRPLSRPVGVEVGDLVATNRVASLPLWLQPDEPGGLVPSFAGSLDAAWLGPGRTHLALALQYEPPLGAFGRVADRALLHRVAETMARRLLQSVAERLTDQLAGSNHAGGIDGRAGSLGT